MNGILPRINYVFYFALYPRICKKDFLTLFYTEDGLKLPITILRAGIKKNSLNMNDVLINHWILVLIPI
jgi:hypothetical protein